MTYPSVQKPSLQTVTTAVDGAALITISNPIGATVYVSAINVSFDRALGAFNPFLLLASYSSQYFKSFPTITAPCNVTFHHPIAIRPSSLTEGVQVVLGQGGTGANDVVGSISVSYWLDEPFAPPLASAVAVGSTVAPTVTVV